MRIGKLVVCRPLGFGFLLGHAERTLHAACDATYRTSDDGANSAPNRPRCLAAFPRP